MNMRKYNWSAWGDEPDDWDERREDAIEKEAEKLLSDPDWIEAVLHEGIVDAAPLVRAIAEDYKPGITHSAVGGHLMDALWKIAKREASHYIDDGEWE